MTWTTTFLGRFLRNDQGLAAIEFALIAPIMLFSLLGAIELTNSMYSDRAITQTASTLADLVSQDTEMTSTERDTIFAAANGVVASAQPKGTHFRITSIVADSKGKTTADWSFVSNTGSGTTYSATAKGTTMTVPDGIVAANGSIILAEARVVLPSLVGRYVDGFDNMASGKDAPDGMISGFTLEHVFYLKPRRSVQVIYKP